MDNDTTDVITNLLIGTFFFISALIVYDLLRYCFPQQHYCRENSGCIPETRHYDGSPLFSLPRPPPYPLSWIPYTFSYSESDTIMTHGLDVAMYLRFLGTQTKLFGILMVYTAIVLYPTYATASNQHLPDGHPNRPIGIEILSLSNIPDKSPRLWITLLSEIFVVTTICIFLHSDIHAYAKYRRKYRSHPENPANYAIIVQDIPKSSRTRQQVYGMFDRVFPNQIADVHIVRDAHHLLTLKKRYISACRRRERAEVKSASSTSCSSSQSSSSDASGTEASDDVSFWKSKQDKLKQEVHLREENIDDIAPVTHTAIVIFRTKRAATFAVTSPIITDGKSWHISRAPEPSAANWERLCVSSRSKRIRQYLSFISLTALSVLWTIPAGLIQAIGNFEAVAGHFPDSFIEELHETRPRFSQFVEENLPPLLLFLVLLAVPSVMHFIVSFERMHSRVLLDAKARNYLFFFYVMSNFTYVVIIGGAFKKLKTIVEKPTVIISALSTSVPAQATFLMKYVLINSFLGSTFGMVNTGRLFLRPFMLAWARTKREKQKADDIFTDYPFYRTYALCTMVSLISFVYSTIAPVICAVAFLYFCIAYLCTKQLLLYSHRPRYESGGYLFRDAWTGLSIGLFVRQVSMIGIFALKRATAQAIVASFSFIASIWFTLLCQKTYLYCAKHGSVLDQIADDEEVGLTERVVQGVPKMYMHPGLRSIEELESLYWEEGENDSDSEEQEANV